MRNLGHWTIAVLIVGFVGLAAIACADDKASTSTGTSTATTVPTGTNTPAGTETTTPGNGDDEIEVQMTDNLFQPAALTIPVGKTVKIKAKNAGTAIHNMHILSAAAEGKDFTSDLVVNAGSESEFEVTFTKPGAIQFQCDFHVPAMIGTITVQ